MAGMFSWLPYGDYFIMKEKLQLVQQRAKKANETNEVVVVDRDAFRDADSEHVQLIVDVRRALKFE